MAACPRSPSQRAATCEGDCANRTEFAQPGKNHLTAIGGFEDAGSALCDALQFHAPQADAGTGAPAATAFAAAQPLLLDAVWPTLKPLLQ